ncbi:MAG TPA: DMT family transporter [Burkholderiaceae bacterium]|nr:DMT family transporter [Burkholderiaceae bacterium]
MQSLWVLVAAALLSVMSTCVKLASQAHSPWEILFWRNTVGLCVLVPVMRQLGGGLRHQLATPHWPAHLVRNLSGVVSVLLWFASIAHLPIATSVTLNYTSSLFIGVFVFVGAAWAGQPLRHGSMLMALGVGFVGIVLMLRPTIDNDQLGWALVGLASGALSAMAMMSVRAMGKLGEPSSRIVFYFTLSGLIAGAIGTALTGAHMPDVRGAMLLFGIGVSSVLAQLAVTRAFAHGAALLSANLNYVGILFASFWGRLIWGDKLPALAWGGIALIIAAGATATWLTANATKPSVTSE